MPNRQGGVFNSNGSITIIKLGGLLLWRIRKKPVLKPALVLAEH